MKNHVMNHTYFNFHTSNIFHFFDSLKSKLRVLPLDVLRFTTIYSFCGSCGFWSLGGGEKQAVLALFRCC
jgi:hypothetical protein